MFGSVTEWFYRWLGGIRPDPGSPGFKEFILAPSTPEGLEFVNCTYHSPFGQIVSNWRKVSKGTCQFELKIPAESMAMVTLPVKPSQRISMEKEGHEFTPEKRIGLPHGNFKLGEGEYLITVSDVHHP
jgi:alpha-L-rhamnosidase